MNPAGKPPDTLPATTPSAPEPWRIPEGTPTEKVNVIGEDGNPIELIMEATPAAGNEGSFNTVHRLAGEYEGKVARISKTQPDTPASVIDEFGRTALTDPAIDPDIIRPLPRERVNLGDGRQADILPYENRLAERQFKANPDGQPTAGQSIAMDKAIRQLNDNGYAWLDNHAQNYFFEKVPGSTDDWQVVVLDTGGIVKAADGNPQAARAMQSAVSQPTPEYVNKIKEMRAGGADEDSINAALRQASWMESAKLSEDIEKLADPRFGGNTPLDFGNFEFRADSLAEYPQITDLFIVEGDAAVEAAYQALRAAQ